MKSNIVQSICAISLILCICFGVYMSEKQDVQTTDVLISTQKFNETFNTSFIGIIVEDINEYHLYDIINKEYIMLYSADSYKGGANEWYTKKSMIINESVVKSAHSGFVLNFDNHDVYEDWNKLKIYYYGDNTTHIFYDNILSYRKSRYIGATEYWNGIPNIDTCTRNIVNYTAIMGAEDQKYQNEWVYPNKTYSIYNITLDYDPELKDIVYLIQYIDNKSIESIVLPKREKPSRSRIDDHEVEEIITGNKSTLTLKSIHYDNYPESTDGSNQFYWVLTLSDNSIELKE